jgi:hypothetical protein
MASAHITSATAIEITAGAQNSGLPQYPARLSASTKLGKTPAMKNVKA